MIPGRSRQVATAAHDTGTTLAQLNAVWERVDGPVHGPGPAVAHTRQCPAVCRRRAALVAAVLLYAAVVVLSIVVVALVAVVCAATGDARAGWGLVLLVAGLVAAHVRVFEGWEAR